MILVVDGIKKNNRKFTLFFSMRINVSVICNMNPFFVYLKIKTIGMSDFTQVY